MPSSSVTIEFVDFFPEHKIVGFGGNHSSIGVISITEPGRHALFADDAWSAVLRLQFHDKDRLEDIDQGYVLFDQEHAQEVLTWLQKHENDLRAVYVHCALGASRSAAVALFVAEKYGLRIDRTKASRYNRRVYRVLYDEWTKDPKVRERILAQALEQRN